MKGEVQQTGQKDVLAGKGIGGSVGIRTVCRTRRMVCFVIKKLDFY